MEFSAPASWAWIPIVIWAALAQTIRNAAQRSLVSELGTLSATLVRFLYGLPFAGAWLLVLLALSDAPAALPHFSLAYGLWLFFGAGCQITATACLLMAMKQRNFIVGVAFSKTEVLQVGIFATVMLQEIPSLWSALAMVIATMGVVLLSLPAHWNPSALRAAVRAPWKRPEDAQTDTQPMPWRGNAAWYGLASGAFFALSSVGYRGAALQLPETSAWLIGAWGVLLAQTLQSLLLGGWIALRQPGALKAIASAWRMSTVAGAMGAMASIGWLTAVALRPAVDVRTLGLAEVLFSYLVSRKLFKEQISRKELAGLLLVGAGVVVVSAQL